MKNNNQRLMRWSLFCRRLNWTSGIFVVKIMSLLTLYLVSNGNKLYFPSSCVFLVVVFFLRKGGEEEKVRSLAFLQFIHLRVRVLRVCVKFIF